MEDPGFRSLGRQQLENELSKIREPSADLFGIQLEVTFRLLEAEKRKLSVLQSELGQLNNNDYGHDVAQKRSAIGQIQSSVTRFQLNYNRLEQEYKAAAMGMIKRQHKRGSSRSQPAIGLKQTSKSRPSIFGTIAKEKPKKKEHRLSVGPQMISLSRMFDLRPSGYDSQVPSHYTEDEALIFEEGNLMAGSLEALIQHLVPTTNYHPDRTYVFAFLLSSRLYIKPHILLKEVCQICVFQQNLAEDEIKREQLGTFGPNILQLLGEWTEMFPYDFRDDRMMKQLKEITQRIISIYPELQTEFASLTHNLINKLSSLHKYEEELSKINTEAVRKSSIQEVPTTDITEICPSPLECAQQLTHIELERLGQIGPEEFVQAFAKETVSSETSFKDMKKTSNLEAYVNWFNRLSYLITTEICSHLKKKNRVKVIEYFLDVGKECINIGNFNSLIAIIAGLNMSQVSRLKKTWAKVNTAKFEILEHQMDPSNNFGSYRSCLKAAMWRSEGATNEREKIVIPFFSLFVKDLYFLNEGHSSKLENGNINFEKFWQLAKQISGLVTWQQVQCPFEKKADVLHYILTNPVFSESNLSLASFECEAPFSKNEKERHKDLKSKVGIS
ncbi:ras-GEF domain-containing family member 1B-like isoform X1 [Mytilus californianus]|uniref:ras-GEF domain-containing family member 1B-like isoform X1 n=2 Tax=Mytilus californianus TaxID=6549 RepID=UPI0022474DCE|nr:ras-GEF domain-containing family member 1B-like isoform X1 [Mytilus californianus]